VGERKNGDFDERSLDCWGKENLGKRGGGKSPTRKSSDDTNERGKQVVEEVGEFDKKPSIIREQGDKNWERKRKGH